MNVCFIGKHIYPKDIFSNEQDMKTWRSMATYFGCLSIIVQSPDLFFHYAKENNVAIYLVPNFFSYFGFVASSVILGLCLKLRRGVDVFDASEVIGGGIVATILKFLTGTQSVVEIQGEIFKKNKNKKTLKSWLLKKIGHFVMKQAARIRVISNAIFNQVKEQGIPAEKIRLVSLRVDLKLFDPSLWVSETYKSGDKMGITIGYLGRLIDSKGLEDLFRAIAILKLQNLEFNCLIFGNGPLEEKLKKTTENLEINDKIKWRGFVPYSKVPEALSQIDIFVYPSWHEGFGRSIMEALAMEKAVVATRVGGIPDLIKDNVNGFLVSPHNSQELAQKIKELVGDKELRNKFGKAGRKWVSENFEWGDGIKKFANLFLELK